MDAATVSLLHGIILLFRGELRNNYLDMFGNNFGLGCSLVARFIIRVETCHQCAQKQCKIIDNI